MVAIDKKIIFCFPYRGAGGVPLLFLRLANYLKVLKYDVAIVDYSNGFMAVNNKNNIDFIEYRDGREVDIPKDSILVFQTMTPWSIYPSLKINGDTEIFFITTIPTNFYPLLPFLRDKMSQGGLIAQIFWNTILRDEYLKVKKFLKLGTGKNSIVFLDDDVVCNVKKNLGVNFENPELLPLFSESIDENLYLKEIFAGSDTLVLGWVGRIADFKVHILNRVIQDLKTYADKHGIKIKLVIVGEGGREEILFSYNTEKFETERIKHIEPENLYKKLLTFDLYFAMGTSALDGARLGIPTVRLDYSFDPIDDDYKYKFLFDTHGYSMGELIGSQCFHKGHYSMEEVISKLLHERVDLSNSIYNFYNKNHSVDTSALKFLDFIGKSTLQWKDLVDNHLTESRLYSTWKKIRR